MGMALSPGSRDVATLTEEKTLETVRLETGEPLHPPVPRVRSFAFSPDATSLAYVSTDDHGAIRMIDLEARATSPDRLSPRRDGLATYPNALSFDPNGQYLVAGTYSARAVSRSGRWLGTLDGEERVYAVDIRARGDLIAIGTAGREIRLLAPHTWEQVTPPLRHEGTIEDLAFDPTGTLLAALEADDAISVWRLSRLESLIRFTLRHDADVTDIAFHPQRPTLAVSSDDGAIWLYDFPPWDLDLEEVERKTGLSLGLARSESSTLEALDWREWQLRREEFDASQADREGARATTISLAGRNRAQQLYRRARELELEGELGEALTVASQAATAFRALQSAQAGPRLDTFRVACAYDLLGRLERASGNSEAAITALEEADRFWGECEQQTRPHSPPPRELHLAFLARERVRAGIATVRKGDGARIASFVVDTVDDVGESLSAIDLYNAACIAALGAQRAAASDGAVEPGAPNGDEDLSRKAVQYLTRAVDRGWSDFEHLRGDPDLNSIRGFEGFQEILEREKDLDAPSE